MTLQEQHEILEKAREWLSDRDHWCRGHLFQDAAGGPIQYVPSLIVRTCAAGALYLAADIPRESGSVLEPIRMRLATKMPPRYVGNVNMKYDITLINDTCGYEAVMEVFDEAIAKLEVELEETRELVLA